VNFAGITKSSIIDYPNLVACILFTAGCSYDCFYCHNRALLSTQATLSEDEVLAFLKKRAGQLDGIVISGGEPTLQPDLERFCGAVKALGYRIKLDTNGSAPDVVDLLLRKHLVDYVAIDYKAPSLRYREICGACADVTFVHQTIRRVAAHGIPYELRTTQAPTLDQRDFATMREEIASIIDPLPPWRWNTYRIPELYKPEDAARIHAPVC
jgi:pyruvate formate lyase activating enzyme